MKTTISQLDDAARLWVFTTARPLSAEEAEHVLDALTPFLHTWTSHARPVEGAATVQEGRFLLVGAQIPGGDVSGCGTDALFHAVEAALSTIGTVVAPALTVPYRAPDGAVRLAERPTLHARVAAAEITPDTSVFDLTVGSVGALRAGQFEQIAARTWLARYFGTSASARVL